MDQKDGYAATLWTPLVQLLDKVVVVPVVQRQMVRCSYLECGHYFYGPVYLSVTCLVLALLEGYRNLDLLGATADTCSCQFTEAVGISQVPREGGHRILESLVRCPVVA